MPQMFLEVRQGRNLLIGQTHTSMDNMISYGSKGRGFDVNYIRHWKGPLALLWDCGYAWRSRLSVGGAL